jgi:hypothetical protein
VNKKKQKNFVTWDMVCGDDSATGNGQRNKNFMPGTAREATSAPHAPASGAEVFCFFFSKKKRLLP